VCVCVCVFVCLKRIDEGKALGFFSHFLIFLPYFFDRWNAL
jgi:hypothetical protein